MARPGNFVSGQVITKAEMDALGRVYTSGTRPSGTDVYEGLDIWETDTDIRREYDGANWCNAGKISGALTTYTPTLTQSTTPTKTVNAASYQRLGRLVTGGVKMTCTVTTAGTANNAIVVGLPVSALTTVDMVIGSGALFDSSATAWYPFQLVVASATTCKLIDTVAAYAGPLFLGQTGAAMSAAVTTSDIITYNFTYEAAAD